MRIVVTVKIGIDDFDGLNTARNVEEITEFVDTRIVAGVKERPQMEEHVQWSVKEIVWNFGADR